MARIQAISGFLLCHHHILVSSFVFLCRALMQEPLQELDSEEED